MKEGKNKNANSLIDTLVCTCCGKEFSPWNVIKLCTCGKVLYAKYNLEKAKETISKGNMGKRSFDIWRMHEIMPVDDDSYRYSLGEGWTPLLKLNNLGRELGLVDLFIKDEGQNPTGTFKSRGLCAAVSKACELGVKEFVMPSAGNAGAALAAYATRANCKAHVFVPKDAPQFIQKEISAMGGDLILIDGLISDAGRIARESSKPEWFDVSTLKEPYRVEGKKTMGLEIAEQLDWELPDVIVYPCGGGTGIVGMWKAFSELEELDMIDNKRPRMIAVQPSGCAPIVKAFHDGKDFADYWDNANTFAAGLRVPSAIGDYLILKALRESNGTVIMVNDNEIKESMFKLAKMEGIMIAPESAATVIAVEKLKNSGVIDNRETVILFGTGSGFTTPNEW
jgi:threonine synthase